MSYNLFLDDIRDPWMVGNYIYPVELRSQYRLEEWVTVRSYSDFVSHVDFWGLPDKVSFDHDLADFHYQVSFEDWKLDPSLSELSEETGLDCAKWLCEYCLKNQKTLPKWFVHSVNPAGRENIINYLKAFERENSSNR